MTQTHSQVLYWLRYQAHFTLSPKMYWSNDIDNRRFIGPDVQNQLIIHSRLHYLHKRWDFASGVTYSISYAAFPEQGSTEGLAELRPVAEASYEVPLGKALLSQRLRTDLRIFQQTTDESLFDNSFSVIRFRYRIQLRVPVKKDESNAIAIGLRMADEIMVNDRGNFYDQNRVYITGDFLLSKAFSIEAGYIYIHQHRFRIEEYFSRHVIRFSVVHRINLAKRS